MYKFFFKRVIDIVFSILLLLIFLPLFIVSFIFIKLDSKGPFFFFQERIGINGVFFKIFKLRTMTNKKHNNISEVYSNNDEITKVGYYLRRFKVDELPQLLNVLFGDLSLVGPRPLLPVTINELTETEKRRMEVRPGLTGLAQVNGNIYLSRKERLKYDVLYVDKISLTTDFSILIKTILVVLKGEDKFVKKV